MSLRVPTALLDRAQEGPVSSEDFLSCIRESLPYAWTVISEAVERLDGEGGEFAQDNRVPPTDAEQGQLLRALASSSMRRALENHFGVAVEFQNCCKVAVFRTGAVGTDVHSEFISPRAQLLNQTPDRVSC